MTIAVIPSSCNETTNAKNDACCGGPAPSGIDACCALDDATAKAAGETGCGCAPNDADAKKRCC